MWVKTVRVNFPAAADGRAAGIAALWWRLVAQSQRENATFDSSPEPQRRKYSISVTLHVLKLAVRFIYMKF